MFLKKYYFITIITYFTISSFLYLYLLKKIDNHDLLFQIAINTIVLSITTFILNKFILFANWTKAFIEAILFIILISWIYGFANINIKSMVIIIVTSVLLWFLSFLFRILFINFLEKHLNLSRSEVNNLLFNYENTDQPIINVFNNTNFKIENLSIIIQIKYKQHFIPIEIAEENDFIVSNYSHILDLEKETKYNDYSIKLSWNQKIYSITKLKKENPQAFTIDIYKVDINNKTLKWK